MIIRMLVAGDAQAFRDLRLRALRDHPEAFGRSPEEVEPAEVWARRTEIDALSEPDFTLGAFDGATLVGMVGCRRERLIKHRHVGSIWGMYVAPEHRGTGLGRRILVEAIERARAWPDLEQLWLDVATTNASARALYVSCGFRSLAVKPRSLRLPDRYCDEELMALLLK
jgi:ribosomal protein S18 acetylase RimI-like enzyme